MQMYLRLETKHPQQSSVKSLTFQLEMPGIPLLLSELPLLRAKAEAHQQHKTRWDQADQAFFKQEGTQRMSSPSPPCDGSRNTPAARWASVLSTSKVELTRPSVRQGSEGDRPAQGGGQFPSLSVLTPKLPMTTRAHPMVPFV